MRIAAAKTAFVIILFMLLSRALADTVTVPASIQANLTAKLLAFDRNLAARAHGRVLVLLMIDPSEGQSQRIANEFSAALKNRPSIAGLPIALSIADFTNASALAERVRTEHASAVYLSAGLVRAAEAIAAALRGVDVMTVAAEPTAVARGIAVGFDLLSGQPKILLNLGQAKNQSVQLPASVLALALRQGE